MQLQSLISRLTSYAAGNTEIARNRAQAAAFGQIDERRYIRLPIAARIDICWQDGRGLKKQAQSRGINMSSVGASVKSPEPIAVGSAVYIQSKQLQLMGSAIVRHCTVGKSKFLIGLEFHGSLIRSL